MAVTSATESAQTLGLSKPSAAPAARNELGQDDFLTLMMTQLKSQDPTKPTDSEEFLSQLAQFSTVSGIEKLNSAFASLAESLSANRTLQASQLVGRSVLVPGDGVEFDPESGLATAIDLPATVPDLMVSLHDEKGQLVRSMSLAGQGPGLVDVNWDGLDDTGEALPAGRYRVEATGTLEGEARVFESRVARRVEGVSSDPDGGAPLLLLAGGDSIGLDRVSEIR